MKNLINNLSTVSNNVNSIDQSKFQNNSLNPQQLKQVKGGEEVIEDEVDG